MAHAIVERIPLPELNLHASLRLRTAKTLRGIASTACVEHLNNGFYSFELYGDFHSTVIHDPTGRATEKRLHVQHTSAFSPEAIARIKQDVVAFYAAKRSIAA